MSRIHVEAEHVIDAPPERVYAILADYRQGHPSILPESFKDYAVEEGGQGAGTIIHYRLEAGGRNRQYRTRISEPEPGRLMLENDTTSSLVTSFRVTPESGGRQSRVRIATEWEGSGGIGGFFERTFAPGVLRRLYADELNRLASVAGGAQAAAS
jgi:Polyketide cyclase / dehydrase and lipid transport